MFNKDNVVFGLVCAAITAMTTAYAVSAKKSCDADVKRSEAETKAAQAKEEYWKTNTATVVKLLDKREN